MTTIASVLDPNFDCAEKPKQRYLIIDGSNVAYQGQKKPSLNHLIYVVKEAERSGFKPIVVVDANLRHIIDDKKTLEHMLKKGIIEQAPPEASADEIISILAKRRTEKGDGIAVLTNDKALYMRLPKQVPHIPCFSINFGSETEIILLSPRNGPQFGSTVA